MWLPLCASWLFEKDRPKPSDEPEPVGETEWGASALLTPEREAWQKEKNKKFRETLDKLN
jgi:hypothetical protein